MPKKHQAKDFEFLEGLDPIRRRPEMYIGDTGSGGFHHLIKEVVDNAVDEHLDGHVNRIWVNIDPEENVIQVRDNGRGIPISEHPEKKMPVLTGVFTHIHGGSKFGKGAYTSAIVGLHGVGVKAVNALSTWLQVWTVRRKKVWTQEFEEGEPTTEIERDTIKIKRGTIVAFQPDPAFFGDVKVDVKKVTGWLRDTAYLCPGLRIKLKVKGQKAQLFHTERGLEDLLEEMKGEADFTHEPVVIQHELVDVAFAWSDGEGERWKSYVNVSPTPDHGSHVNGVKQAVQRVIAQSSGKKLKGEDIRDGLIGVVHAHVLKPKFRGQTKTCLENKEVKGEVQEVVEDAMRRFVAANSSTTKVIVERAQRLQAARKKFRVEQKAIKATKLKKGAVGVLPGKLIEVPDCPSDKRELFIVEGDGALGTVRDARVRTRHRGQDIHFQEVLPLKGVPLNVVRHGLAKIVKNKEIEGIFKTIGTGVGPLFDLSRARHSKVFILTDADPDGKHIRALLITLFTEYFPRLVEDGRLWVVLNPLYRGVTTRGDKAYGDTIEEVQQQLKRAKCHITRFKGLGEMDADDMRPCIDPATRKVMQVKWGGRKDQERITLYMDKDSTARKELLGVVE
jgi:DNA gyrase subunit B